MVLPNSGKNDDYYDEEYDDEALDVGNEIIQEKRDQQIEAEK